MKIESITFHGEQIPCADISIEYDVVLSEIPLEVFCKAAKIVE